MDFCLVKTGAGMFDTLHAYGLGILLAHASGLPVELQDGGTVSTLTCFPSSAPTASLALLDDVLMLPTGEEVLALQAGSKNVDLRVRNLDGLLAMLFTSPRGVRTCSVREVLRKSRLDRSFAEQAVRKVRSAYDRWKDRISQQARGAGNWLEWLLRDYDPNCPAIPVPRKVDTKKDLSLLMAIDPTFGYSTRRPSSDGLVAHKTNVTIYGASFAVLLAYIGAARFLRAMPVKGDLVVFVVPMAASIALSPESGLPLLAPAEYAPEQALVLQWLEYALQSGGQAQWRGLAYQIVHTQGAQQSIPREQGYLDLSWCANLRPETRASLFPALSP